MLVVHEGEGKGVAEVGIVEGILRAEAEYGCSPGTSVVLDVRAEGTEFGVLPEVDGSLYLEVAAVDGAVAAGFAVVLI